MDNNSCKIMFKEKTMVFLDNIKENRDIKI